MENVKSQILKRFQAPVQLKIAALWTSVMFLYIYADYFQLYTPGKLEGMLQGMIGPFPVSNPLLLSLSALMAVPSVMVFLSLVLAPSLNRWGNIVVPIALSLLQGMTAIGAQPFWIFFSLVEISLKLMIVRYALTWPKQLQEDSAAG